MFDHTPLKRCSKKEQCLHPQQVDGGWLPETAEYFMPHKGRLYCQCHYCRRQAKRDSHTRNADHNNARTRAWYEENKDYASTKAKERNAADPQPNRDRVKAWRLDNPQKRDAQNARYQERYPEKFSAREAVRNAVRRGELAAVATLKCIICGAQATAYHHESYELEHQLDVIPLCGICHAELHLQRGEDAS